MIPIIYFLYIYLFFVLLGALFLGFNLYHIIQFGLEDRKTIYVIIFYILFFFFAIFITLFFLLQIDWSTEVMFQDLFQFTFLTSAFPL